MAAIVARLPKIFRRKKASPLQCSVALDSSGQPIAHDPNHKHTSACFIEFEPLAVVELFQSQGCKACPPALPGIQEASMGPNLLLLTYNVTIFDHTGWKDTFASAAWDQRQRAYAKKWQRSNLFTPQVVVNGSADGNGAGGKTSILDLIQRARFIQGAMDWHIYLDVNDTEFRIDPDKPLPMLMTEHNTETYDILVVVFRDGAETVKVRKSPNKGKKINHMNVVKNVMKIGEWQGGNMTLMLPAPKSAMKLGEGAVVLIQGGAGGSIVAAVKV